MIEALLTVLSLVGAVLALFFQLRSRKELEKTKAQLEREELFYSSYKTKLDLKELEKTAEYIKFSKHYDAGVDVKTSEIIITYSKLHRSNQVLQSIGRASRLKERQPMYTKIWLAINSGLINSVLKNIYMNDDSSSIDQNSVIGMLVGDKIKRDTKSYIYIVSAFILAIALPLVLNYEINMWLLSFVLFLFSSLVLNQKTMEYRISKGFYGNNQYEAREIIGYIDSQSLDDDFTGFNKKRIFPEEKQGREECSGALGGLLN